MRRAASMRVALLLPDSEAGVAAGAVQKLVVQILLPFTAGQLVHRRPSPFLKAHRSLTLVVDGGSILMVVYSAFSAGVLAGIWSAFSWIDLAAVIALDLTLLTLATAIMWAAASHLRLPQEDRITILFCGSQKSMATGPPMATAMFAPHAASVIVLPLMIYHQIQLFVGAALARALGEVDLSAKSAAGRQS